MKYAVMKANEKELHQMGKNSFGYYLMYNYHVLISNIWDLFTSFFTADSNF